MQDKEAEVRKAIAHQSAVQKDRLRQSSAGQAEASVGPGLPQDAAGLAGELNAIEGAQKYAHSLQVGVFHVCSLAGAYTGICFHACISERKQEIDKIGHSIIRQNHFAGACGNHKASGKASSCL